MLNSILASYLGRITSKAIVTASLIGASAGFVACLWAACAQGDPQWVVRGGAWVSDTGAFTLLAGWNRERELDQRRQIAERLIEHAKQDFSPEDIQIALASAMQQHR